MNRITYNSFRLKAQLFLLLLLLPPAGLLLCGRPVAPYLEFPPITRYVEHAPFSWTVFVLLAAAILATTLPFIAVVIRSRPAPAPRTAFAFPRWGWAGIALTAAAWGIAWTRLDSLDRIQIFTFSPIWIGYIITINALTYARSGRCLLTHQAGYLGRLFAWSAVFWWFFEYLNRFVQNWYYLGIADLDRIQYLLYATLPFATVLPAVLSTDEWLKTFPRLTAGLDTLRPIRIVSPRLLAWITLGVSSAGLAGIGLRPDLLFPLLWLAPLLIAVSLQALHGQPTLLSPLAHGNWARICRLALAALICGFFWELWNAGSLAKWEYAIPYVHRFKLFEMPILGYSGYLPFGLECAVIADMLVPRCGTQQKG